MKVVPKMIAIITTLVAIYCAYYITTNAGVQAQDTKMMTIWQIKWGVEDDLTARYTTVEQDKGWIESDFNQPLPTKPTNVSSAWFKLDLPQMDWESPALLINKIYGQHIVIRIKDTILYESHRTSNYEVNKIIVPLQADHSNQVLYIGIATDKQRIGFHDKLIVGKYAELLPMFMTTDLMGVILGSSFIFVSIVMLICSIYLRKNHLTSWLSLAVVMMSTGVVVMTNSSYLYTIYGEWERGYTFLFECSLFILLPAVTTFFETLFGSGYVHIVKQFRRFQMGYSAFCFTLMLTNMILANELYGIYHFFSVTMLCYTIIIQSILLVISSIMCALKGNRDAFILSLGLTFFAGTAVLELLYWYSKSGRVDFFSWKWGVVGFVISLIVINGRRMAINHDQVIKYSKELALFNEELHRSEKMEMISELAASVAHEVRNPLQVTRGFLQLLTPKYDQRQQQDYLVIALEELDRASNIITNFLTFAKPGLDRISVLPIHEELKHIEGILLPLANLSLGQITVNIPKQLRIKGNSSKFKQALVNVIKNSIESWSKDGVVHIWAYQECSDVVIHIQDNGEGMNHEEISRLGEPYFSNKTKGTGLGLMVAFRIIEAMNGEIHFVSQKGVGTEVIITFPSILE